MMYCEKHSKAMPISECPVCIREERDRLRVDIEFQKNRRADMCDALKHERTACDKLRELVESIKIGLLNGLRIDGAHHKQYDMWRCLVEIVGQEEAERIRDDEEEGFEEGIPA